MIEEDDGDTLPGLTAAALSIPPVHSREDLLVAVRYGDQVPGARWYITKRANALGAGDHVPASWWGAS